MMKQGLIGLVWAAVAAAEPLALDVGLAPNGVAFAPDDKRWACFGAQLGALPGEHAGRGLQPAVVVLDCATGQPVFRHPAAQPAADGAAGFVMNPVATAGAWSPDGQQLAWAEFNSAHTVRVWDAATGKVRGFGPASVPVTDEEGNSLPGGGEACAAVGFTPDNRHVIAALWDGRVLVFDVVTGDKVRQLPAVAGLKEVSTMALSPDGEWMALADRRDRFALRRARDGEVFARWELPGRDYPCVRFSADGAYLAVTGHAGVEVREVVTGAVADNVPGAAVSVAFDPTGRLLVVAQATGDVIVWDRYAGAILAKHDAPIAVESVTFTPDGRRVALTAASTGADDDEPATNRTVWLWEFDRTALASPTESVAEAAGLETYRQVCAMAARGAEAVAWLEQEVPAWLSQLAQPAATAAQVATWIGKLDDATFQTRKEATEQLRRLGPMARPALRAALTNDLPVEARERIRDLLQHAETWSPLTVSPADLQLTRAVQVLRQINTAAARELLRNIAAGPADAHATRAAQAGR